jgi:hypothetical protein
MKRCDFCGGRFGLISHRHFRKRFCRKSCKESYFAARVQKIDFHRRHWIAVLARSTSAHGSFP